MRLNPPDDLGAATKAIEAGGLVVVPTIRWYMICAAADNPAAYNAIRLGKKRPTSKPLALVVPSLTQCRELFGLTPEAEVLAAAFWPGDLALLLPWQNAVDEKRYGVVGSPALTTYAPGVLGALAASTQTLIAATTVNVSGDAGPSDRGPAITLAEVSEFLDVSGLDAMVIDGGICPAANHLTIVDCTKPDTALVRSGMVHPRALSCALGRDITLG